VLQSGDIVAPLCKNLELFSQKILPHYIFSVK